MGKEPQNLSVVLSAWCLNHVTEQVTANKKTVTAHTAGDKCSWQATKECTFKLGWGTDPKGSFTDVPLTTIDRGQGQVPLLVGSVPYRQKVYIKVDATPTKQLSIFTQHTHAGAKDTATTDGYWAGTCYYQYLDNGQWAKRSPESSPGTIDQAAMQDLGCANFSPPYSLSSTTPQKTVTAIITFFLSQVRECTYHCEQTMHESPWQPQQVQTSFVQATPVVDGKLQYDQNTTVNLNSTDRVLEVKNFIGPQMLSISWPNENDPSSLNTPRRKQNEFFVFFHASYEQATLAPKPAYINSPYPYGDATVTHGGDYVQYGLYRYIRRLNPFDDCFPLGLPHSMRQAGKTAVTILPMNRQMTRSGPHKPELPNLNDGEQCQCLLEEIQCFMQRAQGYYFFDPDIGAMGCGSFSQGHAEMQVFQHAIRHHPFLGTAIKQFFLFDPFHGAGTGSVHAAQQFRTTGVAVRLYNNRTSSEHSQFVHKRSLPDPPYVVDSDDGQYTVGVITDPQMRNTRSRMLNLPIPLVEGTTDTWVWQQYHANFVTTFLVDALRKSTFR